MEQLWTQVLDLIARFVVPDWGSLVALIPVGLAAIVGLGLAWLALRFLRAGPADRRIRRQPPRPPEGVHLVPPSVAPFFLALGTFVLFAGLLFGPLVLGGGIVLLLLAALQWAREAIREYRHLEPAVQLPAPVAGPGLQPPTTVPATPPPGVHLVAPSIRPILVALATFVVFLGLVFGPKKPGDPPPLVLLAGIVFLLWSLIGWLRDAIAEYRAADGETTEAAPHGSRIPWGGLAAMTILVLLAALVEFGILPPAGSGGGSGPAPTSPPAGSSTVGSSAGGLGAVQGQAAGSAAGVPSPQPSGDVTVTAQGIAFLERSLTAPAGRPFTLVFRNEDPGVLHNVVIETPSGQPVAMGDTTPFPGPKTVVYQVAALQPGTYPFLCIVHPTAMTGTLTVR
jgi:plastocyanin